MIRVSLPVVLALGMHGAAPGQAASISWPSVVADHDCAFVRRIGDSDRGLAISWPASRPEDLRVRLAMPGNQVDLELGDAARRWLVERIQATPATARPEPATTIKYANGFAPALLLDAMFRDALARAPATFTASLHRDGSHTILATEPERRPDQPDPYAAVIEHDGSRQRSVTVRIHGVAAAPQAAEWSEILAAIPREITAAHASDRAVVLAVDDKSIAFLPRGPSVAIADRFSSGSSTVLRSGARLHTWSSAEVAAHTRVPPFLLRGCHTLVRDLPGWLAAWSPGPGAPHQDPLLWFLRRP